MNLLSFEEARARVLESAVPVATERVRLEEALGRVLRERIVASDPVPPFSYSAMDGFALRAPAGGGPLELLVSGESRTGHPPEALAPGTAFRISTGAIIPEGADAGPIELEAGSGVLELHPNGYGFLRSLSNNLSRERSDPFVPGTMIEKFRLREGVLVSGMVQPGRRQQGPRLKEIMDVDGMKPEDYSNVKSFDQLTPINPESWLQLETGQLPLTTRVIDMLTPEPSAEMARYFGRLLTLKDLKTALETAIMLNEQVDSFPVNGGWLLVTAKGKR